MTHVDEFYITYNLGSYAMAVTYTEQTRVGEKGFCTCKSYQNVVARVAEPNPAGMYNYRKLNNMLNHMRHYGYEPVNHVTVAAWKEETSAPY